VTVPAAEPAVIALGDSVFALSQLVDLHPPRTWVAPGATGYDPSTCYLILDGGEACLIDTGFAAHGPWLRAQLLSLVTTGTPLHIAFTRVEPDCLGNLLGIVDEFNVVSIASQTNVLPLDYIGPLSGRYPKIRYSNGMRPGSRFTFGDGRVLEVVEPVVRILPTLWFHDPVESALFTSDFFGGVHLPEPRLDAPARELDVDGTVSHLLAKFDWLAGADTSRGVRLIDEIAARSVGRLCPGHGLWAEGKPACAARIATARAALAAMPGLPAARLARSA
jgi:glyoxylase-like metal-dependent hydrolase (beta-lactamase superfamily II)